MRLPLFLAGLMLGLLHSPAASTQPVRIHVHADSVRVGEPFFFSLAADHAPGVQTFFPRAPRARVPESGPLLQFGDVEILDGERLPPVVRGDVRTDSIVFQGVVFVLDSARVGPVPVQLVGGGDTTVVESSIGVVFVASAATAGDEPAGFLDPMPFPDPRPVWAALGLLGILLLSLAGWGLLRLRRSSRPPDPQELPIEEARRRLAALDLLANVEDDPRDACIELSDTMRTYLERRLGVLALEHTTRETDAALAIDARVSESLRSKIRDTLGQCDLVKFAEVKPPIGSWTPLLERTRETIEELEVKVAQHEERARAEADLEVRMERGP